MAWGWLQSFSGRNLTAAGNTTTATPGANLTSGSTLIAVAGISNNSAATCSGISDASSNAFVKVATSGFVNGQETSLWALNTPAGDAGAKPVITATSSVSNGPIIALLVAEFSGIASGTTLAALADGTPAVKTGSTNTATGTTGYASTAAGELLVMGYSDDGGPLTWVIPAGSANDSNGGTPAGWNTDANIDVELAFRSSANGTESDSWGLSGTATGWGIISAAFRLAAGGGGAAPVPVARAAPRAAFPPAFPASRLVPVLAAPAAVSSSDAAAGSDAGEAVVNGTSGSETASAAEAGQVTASVTSAETASAADGGEQIPVAALPVAQAPPRPPPPRAAVPSSLVPLLTPAGLVYDSDTASVSDAGEVIPPALQPAPLTARPGPGWQQRYGPRNRPRPQAFMPSGAPAPPVPVSDADAASGEEFPGVVFGSAQAAQVNSAAAVTSQASSLPAGVTQGNLVVACLASGNNATSVTPPDASWRQAVLNQPAGASATIEAGVWYLVVDAAHAGQSSWTWTFSASHTVYIVTREWYCSAGWPSSPADVTAQGDTAGTPAAGTAVSSGTTAATSSAPELEVAALAYKGTAQAETGLSAGWSQGLEATLAANNTLREAYRVSSAPEAASASLSVGTAQFWAGAVAVFAPGPGSPSDSDAASAAESGEAVAASLASADAASAAEAGETAALSSPDAASAAESAEAVSLSSPDAASAADAGEAAGPLGSPGPPVLTRQPGAAWAARYGPPGRARPQFLVAGALPPGPPAVFDSDDVHAEDSGFAALSDAEAASAADGDEAAAVASAETSSAAEAEKAAWPQDRDAASAAEAQHWSGPLSDPAPEQGRAADGGERLALASAEASSAADAAPVVEVYSFQPPFRWDGGGFELVWHAADGPGGYTGITVWRGPLPDGAAFRVWKVLSAASRVILVTDADTAAAREEHDPAIAGVSVSVAPAVTLLIQAG